MDADNQQMFKDIVSSEENKQKVVDAASVAADKVSDLAEEKM